jgi:hypothetical protein
LAKARFSLVQLGNRQWIANIRGILGLNFSKKRIGFYFVQSYS